MNNISNIPQMDFTHPKRFLFPFFHNFHGQPQNTPWEVFGGKRWGRKKRSSVPWRCFSALGPFIFSSNEIWCWIFLPKPNHAREYKRGYVFQGGLSFSFLMINNIDYLFHFLYFNTLIFNINEEDCCLTLEPLHDFSWYQPHFESF